MSIYIITKKRPFSLRWYHHRIVDPKMTTQGYRLGWLWVDVTIGKYDRASHLSALFASKKC